jgi:hypothetical protein
MEIALGVVLGLLGVALAALAAYVVARRAGPRPPTPSGPEAGDDLPGFLEFPPGTAAAPAPASAGWAVLAPPPVRAVPPSRGRDHRLALGAMAAVGVLLIALAVALLTGDDDSRPHRHGRDDAARDRAGTADGVAARLTFRGVVLERHAVGITATYPGLEVSSDGERALAHLELPTFHCLTDQAPEDPVAAGCRRSVTEYADLDSPGLTLTGSGDRLRLAGDFATYLRPDGGTPEPTGRVYEVDVSAVSDGGTVEGTLDLGSERTTTTPDPEVNVLRRGS